MSAPILLDFHDQPSATKALKKVAQYMQRAGQPVVSSNFDPKVRRTSGVSFREALLTLASGQTVTLRVTQTGDVFQVLLNGSIKPIKNAGDQIKAIGEIASLAEANQAAFQKKQARVKVELPKGIKTAAPRMEVALQSRVAELDAQIAERTVQVGELKAELGDEVLDAVSTPNLSSAAIDQLLALPLDGRAVDDGDMLSKQGRDELHAAKFVTRDDGANWLSESGKKLAAEMHEKALDSAGEPFPRLEADGKRYSRDQYELMPTDEHGEMPPTLVLKADALPVEGALDGVTDPLPVDGTALGAQAHDERMAEARSLAERIAGGETLDSADTSAAVATLRIALEIVETNSVINLGEGRLDQAELEQANAESFRAALAILDGAGPPKIQEPEEPVPSKAGDPAIKATAEFQYHEEVPSKTTPEPATE